MASGTLMVIFISPLYFALRKKWGAFTLNAILYGLACIFLLSIIGAFIAPIFWVPGVGHAGWHLRTEMMTEHAEMIAAKMAEKMKDAARAARVVRAAASLLVSTAQARRGQAE